VGAELHKICLGRMANDVKAARKRGSEIEANSENPTCNESDKEGRGQQARPEDGAADSQAQFIGAMHLDFQGIREMECHR
jgi:hypothetical protein